jgi:adenylylsulfate kinase-like enzyme
MTPHIFWFFGLSGAGKTTLGDALAMRIRGKGQAVLRLDGDRVREDLNHDLGFCEKDRMENIRRAACVAKLGIESGLVVVASFITPKLDHRKMLKEICGKKSITLIRVTTSDAICYERGGFVGIIEAGDKVLEMTSCKNGDIARVSKLIDICK